MVHVELAAYVTALLALYIAESPARGTVSRGRRIHYPCTYFWPIGPASPSDEPPPSRGMSDPNQCHWEYRFVFHI